MISEQNSNVEEPDHFEVSVDLQRDILNLILTDRDFLINSLSLVKPDYFEDYAHQQICKKCQDYFQEYNDPITLDILSQEIKNAFEINRQLPRILSEIDIVAERINEAYKEKAYLNKAVVDFAKKQAMKFAIMKSVDLLSENKYDQIEQLIRDALLVAPNVSLGMNYFDDVSERYQRILMQLQGERFTTGWPTIDMNLNGGMGKKEVGMIFANSGVGKSIWCGKVSVENVIRDKNVLYISCEMSEDRVSTRVDSMVSLIGINDLIHNIPDLKKRLQEIRGRVKGTFYIKEFSAGAATINDFRAYTNQLYNYTGFKPDVVVLDYIDEVKCSNARLNTYEGQYHTLREFRAWMSDENLAGYTATQANRLGTQVKTITEGEIGDSYAKIRVVDAAWSLNQNDDEKNKGLMRLFAVKHRNAKSRFTIWIKIDPNTLRMKEITENEYANIFDGAVPINVNTEENC